MKKHLLVSFLARKSLKKKNGMVPIYCRIRYDNGIIQFNTKIDVFLVAGSNSYVIRAEETDVRGHEAPKKQKASRSPVASRAPMEPSTQRCSAQRCSLQRIRIGPRLPSSPQSPRSPRELKGCEQVARSSKLLGQFFSGDTILHVL